ncbi:enoyl-CoA hydratase/isomerase family protein [Ponticaulis koreensis]|uniref:enoyl-CoA hydratase/isomerase family protein n=1 Tax=Ponticaulis koreensis TaxID=1123045 RepID=UPI0003B7A967|nr:enoyl-CoA hydratase/isomerase family protein [Ponticaulis koreensis]
MTDAPVLIRREGRAGRITLNRAGALHALNKEMCEIMISALQDWRNDASVELVLIDHAEGTRGFCAGGDVLLLSESGKTDGKAGADFFAVEYQLNTLISEYPKPYVALMDGITMGGGVGISVHGTHRVATERTIFAMPETGIGLIPDVGGGYFLPRLAGELGTWLALTGARLKGNDVLAAGIATHYCDSAALGELSKAICTDGLSALNGLKTKATGSFEAHTEELDLLFKGDSVEYIVDALNTGSDWAKAQAETLASKSPLSMKLSLRQVREGGSASFREVMEMEYRIASRLIKTDNFQEGVRAVLVDRDNAPNWSPSPLSAISEGEIDAFFAPLESGPLTFLETN